MAVRTVVLKTGSGPDRAAASGEIRVRRFYPGVADDGTYIHATDVPVALTLPASSVDLEVGEFYWFTPIRPHGDAIVAQVTAGSGSLNFADLVPVDPSSLLPTAAPQPAWFTALATLVAAQVDNGSALDAAIAAKVGRLKVWAKNPDQLVAGAITYTSGLLSSAIAEWPDGVPGVLTILSRQSGTDAVTSYKVTRVVGATTTTYTQPTITRDTSGAATLVPQITVA